MIERTFADMHRHSASAMPLARSCTLTGLFLVVMTCCASVAAQAPHDTAAGQPRPALGPVHPLPGGSWSEYLVQTQSRPVNLYVLHDDTPKPVVILLQGSGCSPLFTIDGDGTYHSTSLFQDIVPVESRRVHFAMIEKPGVSPLKFAPGMSRDDKVELFESLHFRCSRDFYANATKTVRVDDVRAVMTALAGQPWVAGFILAGHSEGTHVVTGVLETRPAERILAAGLFASAGSNAFWNSYSDADGPGSRAAFQRAMNNLRMLQHADDDFMWEGLPARRWRTFTLESTPMDDVRESTVPLFVAAGTRDGSILAPDLFVLEAIRQQPRRPVRYAVVEGGDHAFQTPDHRGHVGELFADFLNWAVDPGKETGTTVFH